MVWKYFLLKGLLKLFSEDSKKGSREKEACLPTQHITVEHWWNTDGNGILMESQTEMRNMSLETERKGDPYLCQSSKRTWLNCVTVRVFVQAESSRHGEVKSCAPSCGAGMVKPDWTEAAVFTTISLSPHTSLPLQEIDIVGTGMLGVGVGVPESLYQCGPRMHLSSVFFFGLTHLKQ